MPILKHKDGSCILVICDCDNIDHNLAITVEHDDEFVYFDFRLNHYLNFWQKIVVAIKYVFGLIDKTLYNSVLVYRDDVKELIEYLKGFVNEKTN